MRNIEQLLKKPRPTLLSKQEVNWLAALARDKIRKELLLTNNGALGKYDEVVIDE